QGILHDVLVSAYTEGDAEQLPEMNTAIRFSPGPAIEGSKAQLAKPASWPDGVAAPQEYHIYTATLEFVVEVPRDDREPTVEGVKTMLSQIRSKVREA